MRLKIFEQGHTFKNKAILALIYLMSRRRVPDIVRVIFYRPDLYGRAASAWTQAVMRGSSAWTVGERELMAAFTSRLNRCEYCTNAHRAVASIAHSDRLQVESILGNWRTASTDKRMRAILGFVEKLTLDPLAISPRDVSPLRAVGLSDEAIEEAVHVCAIFNMVNRIADALGFEIPDARAFEQDAKTLLKRGYK
jgi:uncharacterized peroxidase-related enzyme